MITNFTNHIENDNIDDRLSTCQLPRVILIVPRYNRCQFFFPFFQRKKLFPTQYNYFKDYDQLLIPPSCQSWTLKVTKRFRNRHVEIDRLFFVKSLNEVRDVMTDRKDENDNCSRFYFCFIPESTEKWMIKSKSFWGSGPMTLWLIFKLGSNNLSYQKLTNFTSNYIKTRLNKIHMNVNYDLVNFINQVINTLSITELEIKSLPRYRGFLEFSPGSPSFFLCVCISSRVEQCMFKLTTLTKEPFLCWKINLNDVTDDEGIAYTLDVTSPMKNIIFVAECFIFSKLCNEVKDSITVFEFLASDYINKKHFENNICIKYVTIDREQNYQRNKLFEKANTRNTLSTLHEALQSTIFGGHNKLTVSIFAFGDEKLLQILFDIYYSNLDPEIINGCIICLIQAARNELKSIEFKSFANRILNKVGFFICSNEQIQSLKLNTCEIYLSIFGCSHHDQCNTDNHRTFDVSSLIKWKVAIWSLLIEKTYVEIMRVCVSGSKCFFIDNQTDTNDHRHRDNLERHLMSLLRILTIDYSNQSEIQSFDLKENIIHTLLDIFKKMCFELIRAFSFDIEKVQNQYVETETSTNVDINVPSRNIDKDQNGSQSISPIQSDGTSNESKIYSLDDLSISNSISNMNTSQRTENKSINTNTNSFERSLSLPSIPTKTSKLLSKSLHMFPKDHFFLPAWVDTKPIFVSVHWKSRALCVAIMFRLLVTGWREISKNKCSDSHIAKNLRESLRSCLNMIRPLMAQISLKEINPDSALNHIFGILHSNYCRREEEILIRLISSSILKKRLKELYPFVPIYDENLIKCKILGSGRFGTVKELSKCIAVKILPWTDNREDDAEKFEKILSEICALQICSEKKMFKLYDYGIISSQVWILIEKGNESLKMWRCRQNYGHHSLCHIIGRFIQIWSRCCSLISQLHEYGIIHNDIKGDNILIRRGIDISNPYGNIDDALFVVDFGEASINRNDCCNNFIFHNRARGTERIQSPEMLMMSSKSMSRKIGAEKGNIYQKTDFPGSSSDVWSLGCLLYEIVTAEYLFDTKDWTEFYALLNHEQTGELPTSKSIDNLYQILSSFCRKVATKELTLCMTYICRLMRVCLKRSREERKSAKSVAIMASTYVIEMVGGGAPVS